jgi:polysaccharide deacetylase family protein (PEP-CTERM system associated)
MTVDVEDWFHADAMATAAPRSTWLRTPCRVERNVDVILALFDQHQVRATFFILGWIARRYPVMVRTIAAGGHELASHGYAHQKASAQSRIQFRRDVIRSKGVIEDAAGAAVIGYRAPAHSVAPEHRWALDTLYHSGYCYSSSSYPAWRWQAGGAPRFGCFPTGGSGILELPLSTACVIGYNLPAGGGSWFRLFPYALSRALLQRVNRIEAQAAVFGFSAWELDAGQAHDFQWGRIDQVFPALPAMQEPVFSSQPRPRWQRFSGSEAAVHNERSRS